jgi:hypothetical protein
MLGVLGSIRLVPYFSRRCFADERKGARAVLRWPLARSALAAKRCRTWGFTNVAHIAGRLSPSGYNMALPTRTLEERKRPGSPHEPQRRRRLAPAGAPAPRGQAARLRAAAAAATWPTSPQHARARRRGAHALALLRLRAGGCRLPDCPPGTVGQGPPSCSFEAGTEVAGAGGARIAAAADATMPKVEFVARSRHGRPRATACTSAAVRARGGPLVLRGRVRFLDSCRGPSSGWLHLRRRGAVVALFA